MCLLSLCPRSSPLVSFIDIHSRCSGYELPASLRVWHTSWEMLFLSVFMAPPVQLRYHGLAASGLTGGAHGPDLADPEQSQPARACDCVLVFSRAIIAR